MTRLGIDLDKIGEGCSGCFTFGGEAGTSVGKPAEFTRSWSEGRVFNRLSMFRLMGQQVVSFERCHISETQPELIYKIRVLTPVAEVEKQITVPI
jgi:hypothetical protein